jgi:hypothetical protein
MNVYAILVNGELFPNYFNTYKESLDEVKIIYSDWDDRYDEDGKYNKYSINKVEVKEGHKMGKDLDDANITELYIEKGIHISIHKLVLKN